MKRKQLSWGEAWQRVLRGECVSAREVSEGFGSFVMHMAWRMGKRFVDSGIGDYRCFSLA